MSLMRSFWQKKGKKKVVDEKKIQKIFLLGELPETQIMIITAGSENREIGQLTGGTGVEK